jgi:hypothetical protein
LALLDVAHAALPGTGRNGRHWLMDRGKIERTPQQQGGQMNKTYTFGTVNPEYIGTSYGYHVFTVQAEDKPHAWDAVRKLTGLVLRLVSVTD